VADVHARIPDAPDDDRSRVRMYVIEVDILDVPYHPELDAASAHVMVVSGFGEQARRIGF
jgi:hypothetical protein